MKVPNKLRAPGRRLWDEVPSEFELAEHEAVQLEEACRARDTIAVLREKVAEAGHVIASPQGLRLHPAVAEIRALQLALARLLATLNVPVPAEDDPPASTGVRGVYALRGAS